jgi:hypothetical protein
MSGIFVFFFFFFFFFFFNVTIKAPAPPRIGHVCPGPNTPLVTRLQYYFMRARPPARGCVIMVCYGSAV